MKIDNTDEENYHDLLHVRTKSELWFDKYNHTMAFIRTIFGLFNVTLSALIACKVFGLF